MKLVRHMGATRVEDKNGAPVMADTSGLIEWASDTRGVLSFASLDEIESQNDVIANIIQRWLAIKG